MLSNRIIVVDDDPIIREIVGFRLQSEGFSVTTVEDGAAALFEIYRHSFDLVLLDVAMPVVDGWEVCKVIRDDPHLERLKVVMLTARCSNRDKMIGKEIFRANDFVTKPFDFDNLMQVVRSQLNESDN